MNRISITVLLIMIACSVVVGQKSRVARPNARQTAAKVKAKYLSEARNEATKAWNLTQCGDSSYLYYPSYGQLIELRAVSIIVTESKLTEADRLNGIEWKGWANFNTSTERFHANNGWSEWYTKGTDGFRRIDLQKRAGTWSATSVLPGTAKILCSDVPKLVGSVRAN